MFEAKYDMVLEPDSSRARREDVPKGTKMSIDKIISIEETTTVYISAEGYEGYVVSIELLKFAFREVGT
jgi:hypothetical protein